MSARNFGIFLVVLQLFEALLQYRSGGWSSFATMPATRMIVFWLPLAIAIVLFIYTIVIKIRRK